jgi:hypothetical protein
MSASGITDLTLTKAPAAAPATKFGPIPDVVPPLPPFVPIVGPQSHYDTLATGLSTEKGDSAMTIVQKINAGFAHVYSMFGAKGSTPADPAGAPPTLLADIQARLAAAEAKLAAGPAAAITDMTTFVHKADTVAKNDFQALVNLVQGHTAALDALQAEMPQLKAMMSQALDAITGKAAIPPTPPVA